MPVSCNIQTLNENDSRVLLFVKLNNCYAYTCFKPGFHLQQTPRPQHKKQRDYVVEQPSFPLIALLKSGLNVDLRYLELIEITLIYLL